MRTLVAGIAATALLAGCGASSASPTATPVAQPIVPTSAPSTRATPPSHKGTTGAPPAHVSAGYTSFVRSMCRDFARRNGAGAAGFLPHYAYNSGVRYGYYGDGEGQTGDPSILEGWVEGAHVHCRLFTADSAGHGAVLLDGWPLQGGWGLVELDIFNGQWKINDFTFGTQKRLRAALSTAGPAIPFTR